ncbi:elongation factor P hydroxylase [Modicisalibacter luteus]|uniref:Elongation factor P hydroxylase n=1 Tax=Modicisalibacter luteus TaxID=453962 RepID=A0ABV7M5P5_9GAMM|nr:elongation factor P hydroxylase [Halomonas lutea]
MNTTYLLDDVIALFDGLFADTYNTRLKLGGDEPLYVPADEFCSYHRVIFARGNFSSALHEISHWCIAGARRRGLEDYGYWYLPDGRDTEQQAAFESAEVAPQALEMLFSQACGRAFHVSVDNLGDTEVDRNAFRHRVEARALRYEGEGLPARAGAFRTALAAYYRHDASLKTAVAMGNEALTERTHTRVADTSRPGVVPKTGA